MRRASILFAFLILIVSTLFAADDPAYTALRAARADGRRVNLSNFVYERDVFKLTLNGTLHLFAPVEGKTTTAVFLGDGSFELKPATTAEQRQLAIETGNDKLTILGDSFNDAVFFAAGLIDAAQKQSPAQTGAPDAKANSIYEDYLKRQRKDLHTNIHERVLFDILNDAAEPLFFAWVDGKKTPPAALIVDPRGAEETMRISDMGGEQTMMFVPDREKGGVWYSSRLKAEVDKGVGVVIPPVADAESYAIDTTVNRLEINGNTTVTFKAGVNTRVLPLNVMGKLRVSSAQIATAAAPDQWTPVAVVQEKAEEDPDAAVVLATPVKAGERYLMKFAYAGKDVLDDAGDGNFSVGARTSWYPNFGTFSDLATYELTFHVPQKLQVVAVGSEVSNRVEGDQRVAVWKSTSPIRVAGFNYGKFKKLSTPDKESGMTVDVYTNPGTPGIITEINRALEAMRAMSQADEEGGGYIGPGHVQIDTAKLAQSAMADGVNTARTGNAYFGPLPQKTVAITQQSEWNFGQSWPSLIYMPYIAFLDGTTRNTLGLNGAKDFIDSVGAHEFAHQWWGHLVGWRSYRDQWLSEGFAEFTSALVAQQAGGWGRYNAFWERARKHIIEKPRGSVIPNDQAGPISQGWRISTWQTGGAYDAIVYSKGAYVLHMLRMTMQERGKPNPDEAFMAMMNDFTQTYAGKNPSTRDFQHIVEKHLTPALKLTSDGKVDWFFNQWVYGTAVPRYAAKLDFQDAGGGKYKVTGSITQSEVPNDFAVVMPIYVYFDKQSYAPLAKVALIGNSTKPIDFEIALPKKPQKFDINAMHDVLAR